MLVNLVYAGALKDLLLAVCLACSLLGGAFWVGYDHPYLSRRCLE